MVYTCRASLDSEEQSVQSTQPLSYKLHSQTFFLNQQQRVETLALANQKWSVPDYISLAVKPYLPYYFFL